MTYQGSDQEDSSRLHLRVWSSAGWLPAFILILTLARSRISIEKKTDIFLNRQICFEKNRCHLFCNTIMK